MEANIGHLPTKYGYKQMQGWKVIQVFVSVTDGRNLDPLVSLHLCGLDKKGDHSYLFYGAHISFADIRQALLLL